jgi:BirA family biotin operon repressor/biotin-[acetyl-CoA-carboxylase] ligase
MVNIRILAHDPCGEAEGLTPQAAAACHPAWADFAAPFCGVAGWRETASASGARWLVPAGTPDGAGEGTWLTVCGPCGSSLDVAWNMLRAGELAPWDGVLALSQRGGRGQMRRTWDSPPGNLYLALALPGGTPEPESLLPVFVGYLLAEYLARKGVRAVFKWPNDLLADEKKVGGTLLEERGGRLVAGIGINLASAPGTEKLRPDHAFPAGSLAGCGRFPGPVPFAADLVKFLQTCYHDCVTATCSFPPVARIERRLAFLGREVLVREGGSDVYAARVLGLAGDGGLRLMRRVDETNRECVIHSGGITLL